ncbi:hypothetical protein BuS5_03120 [Desulfosarcina sp. BuS5]|nr:hypothetical protein BuS5_03120 [Desulfosarcina sp. BuS5]
MPVYKKTTKSTINILGIREKLNADSFMNMKNIGDTMQMSFNFYKKNV